MRLVVFAAMSALGLGLLAMSGASAMPANGVAIDQAAPPANPPSQSGGDYRYRWHRCRYWRRW